MARLTKEQWAEARAQWETDPALSFGQLASQYGLSRPAVSKTAAEQGWVRVGSADRAPEVTPTTKVTEKVTAPPKVTGKVTPAIPAPAIKAKAQRKAATTPPDDATDAPQPEEPAPPETDSEPAEASDWEVMDDRPRVGRPTKYRPEFMDKMLEFFNIELQKVVEVECVDSKGVTFTEKKLVMNRFPTLERFASDIGVTRDTLYDWAHAKNTDGSLRRPDFSYVYARARDLQTALLIEGGISGMYEGRFTGLAAKNLSGWKDQIEATTEVVVTNANVEKLNEIYSKGMESAMQRKMEMLERRRLLNGGGE